MKRFYKSVSLKRAGDHFHILLDGKPVKTPLKRDLECTSEKLAQAIVNEWEAQQDKIDPKTMPMTQLLNTAIDRIADHRPKMEQDFIDHLNHDTIVFRDDSADDLKKLEDQHWTPIYDWVEHFFGYRIKTVSDIVSGVDNDALKPKLKQWIDGLDNVQLTALLELGGLTSSVMIACAVLNGALSADQAFEAAYVEEIYQAKKWGSDPEADARRQSLKGDIQNVKKFADIC